MKRILIVDDEKMITTFLSTAIDLEDVDISIANSGEDAINLLKNKKIDIIILDIMMPKIDGLTVCDFIRNELKNDDIKIIIMSAVENPEVMEKLENYNIIKFFKKPFKVDNLISVIQNL
jgi:CheY-like chemotaxis protein